MKITKNDIEIIEWVVDKDAIELAAIDSLLCDSETQLAELTYKLPNSEVNEVISLEVRGEVRINYNGDTYRYASEYPQELKKILRTMSPQEQLDIERLEIIDNNWCEVFYTINGEWQSDLTDVVDGYFEGTEESVKNFLIDMIIEVYKSI